MASAEELPLKTTEENIKTKITLSDRINYIKENITIEPVILCYAIPGDLVKLATQNLNLDKACRVNMNYGDTICDALIARQQNKYSKEELAVQQLVATMESWKNVIYTAIPCLLILFIGAWSDRTRKRKICILLPIIGDLLMCLSNMLNVYFFNELPLHVTMFFEAFLPAITGGPMTLYMGAFAFLSDATSEESRTFRVGIEELPLKTTEENIKTKITLSDRINYIKENITIEPVILCYAIPGDLVKLATQNLNLDKACRVNMNYGDTICDALIARQQNKYSKEELAVQQLVATMESWKNVIYTAIPCLLILFIGAWSDRTRKRKICILLPIIGDLLMCLSNMLNVYFFNELPLHVTMFFEAFLPAITGGPMTLYMGAFAFLSDATSEESRTFRVGIGNLCFWAAGPIGSAVSGVLLKHIGYYGVFSLSSLFYILSIVYGYYYIENPKKPQESEITKKNYPKERGLIKSFFDIKHVKDTLTVAFKKGPDSRRTKMILILASIVFMYGATSGELTLRYLFARYRFNWDALNYSFFCTFYISTHIFGTFLAIFMLSRHLKWDDSLLGLLAICSKFVGALTTGLARNSRDMYIGKMMSVFNLMEVMTSTVSVPIYSWIYTYTVEYDAGVIYYISSGGSSISTKPFQITRKRKNKMEKEVIKKRKKN
ncbi:putative adenylate cyclase [Operophtera brumata]|uniref:Putative adenylate cyclase n=1 Tax=Operophtera brumata TaxID=104452 RepID=A0A0L7L4T7_OPEBR|nr:putative adenylate cyclase [Operophtera brumata]